MPSVDYDPQRDVDTDLFAVLGAEWEADPAVVRQAWRTASRTAHPDTGGSHDAFLRMEHAWRVLGDAGRRTRYVRAYEARHGPQRRTSGRHRGSSRPRPRPQPSGRPSERRRSPEWRCAEFVDVLGTRGPCYYNRLIGEERCWDHASENGRRAALSRVQDGRCAALTHQGRPCRNPRSAMGFPLCTTHLTVGAFTSYQRRPEPDPPPGSSPHDRGPEAHTPPPPPRTPRPPRTAPTPGGPSPPPRGTPPSPPRSPAPAGTAPTRATPLPCPSCGRRNRVDDPARARCGACRAPLGQPAPRPAAPRRSADDRPPSPRTERTPPNPPPAHPEPPTTSAAPAPARPSPTSGGRGHTDRPPSPRTERTPPNPPPAHPEPPTSNAAPAPSRPSPTSGGRRADDRPAAAPRPSAASRPGAPSRSPHGMPRRPPSPVPRRRSHRRFVGAAASVAVALVVAIGVAAAAAHWWSQPRAIGFAHDIKATSARCSSGQPITADDVLAGFDLTCTMVDDAPGNRDRPYVQVRLDGCDDWQRLDHDDGPDAVTVSTRLAPCDVAPAALKWQVCQTHGGLLPDDCHDGSTDLPSR